MWIINIVLQISEVIWFSSNYQQLETIHCVIYSIINSTLWSFVANFTAFDAKKLYKLYKHACKKRDKKKKEGKTKKDSSKTPKSSSQKRPNETGAGHHGDKQARLSGNAGTHGSSAHSSRPSKDHHENSWRGSNRDNTKDRCVYMYIY